MELQIIASKTEVIEHNRTKSFGIYVKKKSTTLKGEEVKYNWIFTKLLHFFTPERIHC